MSIQHDAGQMVFGCYGGSLPSEGTLRTMLASSGIGGVLIGPWNLRDFTPKGGGVVRVHDFAARILEFINLAKNAGHVVPFIAADQEGGDVQRFSPREVSSRNIPDPVTGESIATPWPVGTPLSIVPTARDVGVKNNVTLAREIGTTIGSELRPLGFNLDFAPIADLNAGYIGTAGRGYHTDPAIVTSVVRATVEGMTAAQIIPCIKHFPGHGATGANSHEEIARITKTRTQLDASDLLPFKQLASSVKMVMVGHLFVDAIDPTLPAVLSPKLITDVLRNEFGFTGVVITDDLFMMGARIKHELDADGQPVAQERTTLEIVKLGLDAGVDIFLSQKDWPAVHTTLVELSTDPVYAPRIAASATRVRELKSTIPDFAPSSTLVDDLKALVASHAATIATVNQR